MTGARSMAPSGCSSRRSTSCLRRIAFMSATITAAGCRCGALTFSTRRSVSGSRRPPGPSTISTWSARMRAERYRCGASSRTSTAIKSSSSICGIMATTPENEAGTAIRSSETARSFRHYASFSIGTPMITLSAPLRGGVRGVLAADLKLDKFSDLVQAQRPGEHGTAVIFDAFGVLLAHPDFARLLEHARHHPSHPQMPQIDEIRNGLIGAVMRRWDGSDRYDGNISEEGQDYIFRLRKFSEDNAYSGYSLLIAAEGDFAPTVRRLQSRGLVLALLACGCFMPVVWIFGSRMSRSLRRLTEQANQLHSLAAPDEKSVTSNISEIHDLGSTLSVAQRTISSYAHFVPKDIVTGIIDGSISTELGGVRQEVTVLFTDVANFTGIAEASDPDNLMRQMSRHFTALTEAFIAEGGTVDKFIGDSVMVFWNAPHLQFDHVERACRAALVATAASEALNTQFTAEGLRPFAVRLGIHFGDAVVGNWGSAERMEYTVLGNSVNLAARLEGLNKEYGTTILVSEAVRDRVHNRFHFNAIASVIAKGMTAETQVFELVEAVA